MDLTKYGELFDVVCALSGDVRAAIVWAYLSRLDDTEPVPANSAIGADLCLSRNTVQRARRALSDAGLVDESGHICAPGAPTLGTDAEPVLLIENLSGSPNNQVPQNGHRPNQARARHLVRQVWDRKTPRPITPFIGAVQIAERCLDAGWDERAVFDAMVAARTISLRWVEAELNKRGGTRRRDAQESTWDRDAPSGVIDDL